MTQDRPHAVVVTDIDNPYHKAPFLIKLGNPDKTKLCRQGPWRLKPSPESFLVASMQSLLLVAISLEA